MRFIVSPAKKMNVVDDAFGWRDLPVFAERAEELARAVRSLGYSQAQELWRCSDALARLNFERFRAFDARGACLTPAVLAYEGIQYRHLAPQVMDGGQLEYLQEHLRIVSGLYGVLRPLDGVAPYRLEMQAKLSLGDARNLYEYWGADLYATLATETDAVVNLASVEYAKAVVPHAQRAQAAGEDAPRVVTCLFGTVGKDGRLVQRSTAAKAARGSMVRWCAEQGVRDAQDLRAFDVAGYRFAPERSDDERLVFVDSNTGR